MLKEGSNLTFEHKVLKHNVHVCWQLNTTTLIDDALVEPAPILNHESPISTIRFPFSPILCRFCRSYAHFANIAPISLILRRLRRSCADFVGPPAISQTVKIKTNKLIIDKSEA